MVRWGEVGWGHCEAEIVSWQVAVAPVRNKEDIISHRSFLPSSPCPLLSPPAPPPLSFHKPPSPTHRRRLRALVHPTRGGDELGGGQRVKTLSKDSVVVVRRGQLVLEVWE